LELETWFCQWTRRRKTGDVQISSSKVFIDKDHWQCQSGMMLAKQSSGTFERFQAK
jgi:hypothetical protein